MHQRSTHCLSLNAFPRANFQIPSYVRVALSAHSLTHITLHCCALILPPDCPNKPKQTAGRQRRDVTHSFEPWRLSAWRRAGGLYSNNKQQASIPPLSPIHLRAAESWEQTGQRSFITSNLWCDYRSAHLQTAIVAPKDSCKDTKVRDKVKNSLLSQFFFFFLDSRDFLFYCNFKKANELFLNVTVIIFDRVNTLHFNKLFKYFYFLKK